MAAHDTFAEFVERDKSVPQVRQKDLLRDQQQCEDS